MIALLRKAEPSEHGFTLIELLVVVIIIGIRSAIAIPTFLKQREKAWDKAVASDLRNNAIKMQEYADDSLTGVFPTGAISTGDYAFKTSDSNNATVVQSAGLTGFCLSTESTKTYDGNRKYFNSLTGNVSLPDCSATAY